MDGSGTADQADRAEQSPGVSTAGASHTRKVDPLIVTQRLQREGRWSGQIELERDEMMKLAKSQFKTKEERQLWVYAELDRLYPPLDGKCASDAHLAGDDNSDANPDASEDKENASPAETGKHMHKCDVTMLHSVGQAGPENVTMLHSCGPIQGLGDIPSDWPQLPSNASLSSEVGWVQANRLRIVEERPGAATLVRLERAHSPAPSWAALGWLETSIRSYAKYVDVAAKATSAGDGEAEVWRHERRSLAEVEALLAEMREEEIGEVCPRCGQDIRPENDPTPPGG